MCTVYQLHCCAIEKGRTDLCRDTHLSEPSQERACASYTGMFVIAEMAEIDDPLEKLPIVANPVRNRTGEREQHTLVGPGICRRRDLGLDGL